VTFEELATPGYRRILQGIREDLFRKLPAIRGAVIEDKDITIAIHYRMVDPRQIPALKTIFHEATIVSLIRNKIKIKEHDMAFEVWPPVNWDKGKIVKWLLARQELSGESDGRVPLYIGDDLTDEDAFRALRQEGVTVFVRGSRQGETAAEYYLRDQKEVAQLLERLLELERRERHG
jgi:trehalose-phosphatase